MRAILNAAWEVDKKILNRVDPEFVQACGPLLPHPLCIANRE
jgi:hypothetical protein